MLFRSRPTREEIGRFSGFFGITLPLVKHGVPVRAVQLDNVLRYPGYLDPYKVLVLSYEFQKPLHPGVHSVLADWVRRGGTLIYVGADTDPFHEARDWWNQYNMNYASPAEHLFETLALGRTPQDGTFAFGDGKVQIVRKHPAYFCRSPETADEYRRLIGTAIEDQGEKFIERNYFLLRRGPYVIAATMNESCSEEPLQLKGRYINLLDAKLPVLNEVSVVPGTQAWLIDLDRVTAQAPAVLTAAGRIESWTPSANGVEYGITSAANVNLATRILLPKQPQQILVDGKVILETQCKWDAHSSTLYLEHIGSVEESKVQINW